MAGFAGGACSGASGFGAKSQDAERAAAKAQEGLQLWSDALSASGRCLELEKMKFHMAHYDFCSNGSAAMRQPKKSQALWAGASNGKLPGKARRSSSENPCEQRIMPDDIDFWGGAGDFHSPIDALTSMEVLLAQGEEQKAE